MPSKPARDLPQTAGELRRLIAAKKYQWTVDPRLRDSDPLPKRPRGGKLEDSLPPNTTLVKNVADYLRGRLPPSNPFLRERWAELKLLKPQNRGSLIGSSPDVATNVQEKTGQKTKRRKS